MNRYDFENKIAELEADFEKKKRALIAEYIKKKNPYKEGEIIEDHIGLVKIERLSYTLIEGFPELVYIGKCLTKKKQLRKDGSSRRVYYPNIKNPK